MARSKRTIKTVDDAQRALIDLLPEGFGVTFDYYCSWSRSEGYTHIHTTLSAYVHRAHSGSIDEFPRIQASSPFDLVKLFVDRILPQLQPKPPAPRRRGIPGPTVPRLTYDPVKDLFS